MSFNKESVLEMLAVEAGLELSEGGLHEKVEAFFRKKRIGIEFQDGCLNLSSVSMYPERSVVPVYSEVVRFDDIDEDQWGASLVVDRVNSAVRRCIHLTAPSLYTDGDVSTGPLTPATLNEAIEEAEDHIVISDMDALFRNLIDDSYVRLDLSVETVNVFLKIKGISRASAQDAVTVNRYTVEYSLYSGSDQGPGSMEFVRDGTYPKFLNKVQIRQLIERR